MNRKQKNLAFHLSIIFVIILIFFLRLYRLDNKVIWYDEACSIAISQKSFECFFQQYFNYKPFYFLLLKFWIWLFGSSIFSMRFLSVLFGLFSICLTYYIGKKLFNKETGLYAALLLSISPFHIYHSQQIKQLSIMVFLVLLSYTLLIKIVFEKQGKITLIALNSFINILIIFTHPYGLAIIFSQFLFLSLQSTIPLNIKKRCLLGQVITLLFIIIWLFIPNQRSHIEETIWWIQNFNLNLFFETLQTLSFGGPRYGLDDFYIEDNLLFLFGNSLLLLFVIFFIKAINFANKETKGRDQDAASKIVLIALWFFSPIFLTTIISILFKPVYVIKHLLYVLPPFYLLIGKGLTKLNERKIKYLILFFIISASIYPLYILYKNDFNIDWSSPAMFIRNKIGQNDTVVLANTEEIVTFLYFFSVKDITIFKNIDIYGKNIHSRWEDIFRYGKNTMVGLKLLGKQKDVTDMIDDFQRKINENKFNWQDNNTWLAVSRWTPPEFLDYIVSYFSQNYMLNMVEDFRGVRLYYFCNQK